MLKIAIILGSTRPGRLGEQVANWVQSKLKNTKEVQYELVDIEEQNLPFLDEPIPPSMAKYSKDHTKKWAQKIAGFDAFIFVTAEYNHSVPGALKNALDFIYAEWNNKAAGFVGYGSAGGARSIEHLRGIMGELQIADVRQQVMFSLAEDFENYQTFKPRDFHQKNLELMNAQLISWGNAMKSVRSKK